MSVVPWLLIVMNIVGVGIMVRYGLPREVPLVGREDADPLLGFIGLAMVLLSITVRIVLTVTAG